MPRVRICLLGGLGNQLHVLAAGWAVAGYNGVNLEIDTREIPYGSNKTRKYELDNLRIPLQGAPITLMILGNAKVWNLREMLSSRFGKELRRFPLLDVEQAYIDNLMPASDQIPLIPSNIILKGHFLDFTWANFAIEYDFPTEINMSNESQYYKETVSNINHHQAAVHIRLGDYLQHENLFSRIPENYYSLALEYLDATSDYNIFTDDITNATKIYPKIISNAKRIFTSDQMSPLETMSVVSRHKKIVAANSTFSSWAGWFSMQNGGKVVCPVPQHLNGWLDGLPPQWIRYDLMTGKFTNI